MFGAEGKHLLWSNVLGGGGIFTPAITLLLLYHGADSTPEAAAIQLIGRYVFYSESIYVLVTIKEYIVNTKLYFLYFLVCHIGQCL